MKEKLQKTKGHHLSKNKGSPEEIPLAQFGICTLTDDFLPGKKVTEEVCIKF